MINIYYCNTEKFRSFSEEGIPLLPPGRKKKAEKLLRKEDRLLSVCTGLLMKKAFGEDFEKRLLFGEHGKPFFEHGPSFSISHSGNYSVLAVSECEIGIDIEMRNSVAESVVKRCFSDDEAVFANLSTENFIRIWEAKEAVLKLLGTGFSFSPKKFSVLPFDEEHEIMDKKIKFICENIEGIPLTAAYSGSEYTEYEISEELPEDLIN